MAMKKTDLESDYGRSNRKIQDTVNTLYCPMQVKKGRAGSLSLLSEILLNFQVDGEMTKTGKCDGFRR